jgi:mono/diheme cytochrome c family protein
MRAPLAAGAALMALSGTALADSATVTNRTIDAANGAAIYQHVCQGCHMPGGKGAIGAAAFPALAHNAKLAASGYPVYMVLNGNGAMPWFNGALSDAQIADVVNYVRTHFGNDYKDAVTPADVAAVRGPVPTLER